MQNISMSDAELLKYAIEHGMIDTALVQEKVEMQKRKEILDKHPYSVWYSEKENVWYTYLPDDSKAEKRKKIKRKNKIDLESMIYDFYRSLDEECNQNDKKNVLSVENLFYEFMSYKSQTVNGGTMRTDFTTRIFCLSVVIVRFFRMQ